MQQPKFQIMQALKILYTASKFICRSQLAMHLHVLLQTEVRRLSGSFHRNMLADQCANCRRSAENHSSV